MVISIYNGYDELKNYELQRDDFIIFNLNGNILKTRVSGLKSYYLNTESYINNSRTNKEIFDFLKVNPRDFIKSIVGYPCPNGAFPEVDSLEDLKKVVLYIYSILEEKTGIPKDAIIYSKDYIIYNPIDLRSLLEANTTAQEINLSIYLRNINLIHIGNIFLFLNNEGISYELLCGKGDNSLIFKLNQELFKKFKIILKNGM